MSKTQRMGVLFLAAQLTTLTPIASAVMTLTPEGVGLGYSLETFATGFPTANFGGTNTIGPIGIGFPSAGGVLVSDATGRVRLFPDHSNGQTAASAPVGNNYNMGNAWGIGSVGGRNFLVGDSVVAEISATGAFVQTIVSGLTHGKGIVSNPANGHLLVSQAGTTAGTAVVWDVDPVAKTKTAFITGLTQIDGISISPNGQTLYVALEGQSGRVLGVDVTTRQTVFDSGTITANGVTGGIDGTAAGAGVFANFVFANLNSGSLVQIDRTTLQQTVIATGGSRGDFVTVDPSDDSLLITQLDSILRLTGPSFANLPGDATGDGLVNADDYARIDRGFAAHLSGYFNGDFDGDMAVTPADYLIIDAAYAKAHPHDAAALIAQRAAQFGADYVTQLIAAVPEPGALSLAVVAGITGLARRAQKRNPAFACGAPK